VAVEELRTPPYELPPRGPAPPRFTLLEALRRELPLAVLPVIILVVAAVAAAAVRKPVYESESRLNVGGLNLTSQSVEGYTAAVTQLAVAYSRSIEAKGVVLPVSYKLHIPPQEVIDRVSATSVQGSSVIRIFAKGHDAAQTQALADAMAGSLVHYAIALNSGKQASQVLLKRYTAATKKLQHEKAALAHTTPNSKSSQAAQTRVDIASLQRSTLGFLFQQSQAGQVATQLVQKISGGSQAKSDRSHVLVNYVVAAAIGGILIGIGLAVSRANVLARRRLEPA
jgi:capsular polysaccharide biosynthesis protein